MEENKKEQIIQKQTSKEVSNKKGFGKFSKIAGITAIVFFSSYLLIQTMLTVVSWFEGQPLSMLDMWTSQMFVFLFGGLLNEGAVAFITITFSLTYSILCIVFACNTLSFSGKNLNEAYKKSNGMIAYAVVFGLWIMVPISILIEAAIPIFILAIILIVMVVAFIIIDVVAVKNLVIKKEKQATNIEDLENQLTKIEKLKNDKIISEEEYNALRNKIIGKN